MSEVIFRPDGFHIRLQKGEIRPLDPNNFFFRWGRPLSLEGNPTLGNLFDVILRMDEPALVGLQGLCNSHIKPYLDEMRKPAGNSGGMWVEVRKVVEMCDGCGKDGGSDIEIVNYMSGVGPDPDQHWALDWSPLENLRDCPIKLIQEVEVTKNYQTLCLGEGWLSLGDFLDAIFDELCFHGAPTQRDEAMKQVMETAAEIDKERT